MTKFQGIDNIVLASSRRTFLKASGAAVVAASFGKAVFADTDRPLVYAYANWSDAIAITYVGKKLIEDNFGYKVELLAAEPAVCYASLQSGK